MDVGVEVQEGVSDDFQWPGFGHHWVTDDILQ